MENIQSQPSRPLDVGFKVFKLDSSNLKTWDDAPLAPEAQSALENRLNDMIDRVKPDRTDLDVVYEIMLKTGLELTDKVEPLTLCGKTVWSVNEASLLICLQAGITIELAECMAALNPARIVLAEQAVNDDTALLNINYFLQQRGIKLDLL